MSNDDEMTPFDREEKENCDLENAFYHAQDAGYDLQISIEKASEATKKLVIAAEAAWEISLAVIKGVPKERPDLTFHEKLALMTSLGDDEDQWWLKKMTPEAREKLLKEQREWDEELPVWKKETEQKESMSVSAVVEAFEEWKRARDEVKKSIEDEKAAFLHLETLQAEMRDNHCPDK